MTAVFGDNATRIKERLEIPIEVLMSRGELTAPKAGPLPSDVQKRLRGRPSGYDPSYCDVVLDMAADGHTIGAIAGRLGVRRDAMLRWAASFPEFQDACARAGAAKLYFWEKGLIHVAKTGGSGSQGTVCMFGVVNAARTIDNLQAADWVNKSEIEHSGNMSLAGVVDRMMAKLDEIAKAHQRPGDNATVIDAEPAADAEFW